MSEIERNFVDDKGYIQWKICDNCDHAIRTIYMKREGMSDLYSIHCGSSEKGTKPQPECWKMDEGIAERIKAKGVTLQEYESMSHTPYHKLVRDKVVEHIKAGSFGEGIVDFAVLDQDKYKEQLNLKLQEEVKEYLQSGDSMELADIVEVIYAILDTREIGREGFERLRIDKKQRKGGFGERIFLKTVSEKIE